jgi:hypothetical protein
MSTQITGRAVGDFARVTSDEPAVVELLNSRLGKGAEQNGSTWAVSDPKLLAQVQDLADDSD